MFNRFPNKEKVQIKMTFGQSHFCHTSRNSGFKKGDSAVYRFLELTHDIYQGMEDRKHTCAVFLDISKAFDRVWHAGLFLKIEQMGIRGNLYGLTTLNKPKSREVYTNDGIITQNIFNAAVPTSIETK